VTDACVAEASRAARDARASSVDLGPRFGGFAFQTLWHHRARRGESSNGNARNGQLPSNAAFCRGPAQGYNRLISLAVTALSR